MFSTYLRQKEASKSHPVKMNRCQFVTIKAVTKFLEIKSLSFVEYW